MRLSEWRASAPAREAATSKVSAVVDPVLAALGAGDDPHCWVAWGEEPANRFTIFVPTEPGLIACFVRVNVPGEGPRATTKLVRWDRVAIGELERRDAGGPPDAQLPARVAGPPRCRRRGGPCRRVRPAGDRRHRRPPAAGRRRADRAPDGRERLGRQRLRRRRSSSRGRRSSRRGRGGREGARPGRAGTRARRRRADPSSGRPPGSPSAAVIFDLDGVIVDSEIWWDEVRRDFAGDHGRRLDDRRPARGHGREFAAMVRDDAERRLHWPCGTATIEGEIVDGVIERYAARARRRSTARSTPSAGSRPTRPSRAGVVVASAGDRCRAGRHRADRRVPGGRLIGRGGPRQARAGRVPPRPARQLGADPRGRSSSRIR